MTIIHKEGFTEEKLLANVPILRNNTLDSMKILITACRNWNIDIGDKLQAMADEVMAATQLTEDIAKNIEPIWSSPPVQKAYEQRNRIQLPGGASVTAYYFEHALRFASEDFLPTPEDVLRAKQKTTGVLETTFEFGGTDFIMVDVGGQRSERKKWLTCFADVSAVIYLVALNEYDMLMEEDDKTNRMEESLKLFQKLSGSQWLKDIPFILFLNKSDLFREKIQTRPLSQCFEDFEEFAKGDTSFEMSCEYIKSQYARVFNGARLYTFITNALDTSNCHKVFLAVRDSVLTKAFETNF
uniref:Uncharacterized protein n=1 Tax=Arcella intermedia TaxID=1963864 RepID=A0A6B2L9L6_9EUKA